MTTPEFTVERLESRDREYRIMTLARDVVSVAEEGLSPQTVWLEVSVGETRACAGCHLSLAEAEAVALALLYCIPFQPVPRQWVATDAESDGV